MHLFFLVPLIIFSITTFLYSLHVRISPMPTNRRAKKVLIEALPEEIEGMIYELGAGFGTLALPLSKKYPHHRVVAYEISPLPFLVLWLCKTVLRRRNLEVRRKDFFKEKLNDAGLCVCYLYPAGMERLAMKFSEELPKGSWIVSNTFALPGWRAQVKMPVDDLWRSTVFLYRSF